MQTAEKVGLGVAGLFIVGLLGVQVATRPDVPDPQPPSQLAAGTVDRKVQTVSTGGAVNLDPYLRPGVRTVVEFTAEW